MLLKEESLTYDKTMKVPLPLEAAEQEVKTCMERTCCQTSMSTAEATEATTTQSQISAILELTCYYCVDAHRVPNCQYKDMKCNYNHKKVQLAALCHFAAVCYSKRIQNTKRLIEASTRNTNQVKETETRSPKYTLFNDHSDGDPLFLILLSLNKSM